MPQFDLFRPPPDTEDPGIRYLLDVQSDDLRQLDVRVVVPLVVVQAFRQPLAHLNPTFIVEQVPVLMATQLIGGVAPGLLGPAIANLAHRRDEIIGALDFLITGV